MGWLAAYAIVADAELQQEAVNLVDGPVAIMGELRIRYYCGQFLLGFGFWRDEHHGLARCRLAFRCGDDIAALDEGAYELWRDELDLLLKKSHLGAPTGGRRPDLPSRPCRLGRSRQVDSNQSDSLHDAFQNENHPQT